MDAIEAIKTRRSIRAYQDQQIPREILSEIVDCARLAPTAMNQQLWEFVVITDKTRIQALANAIGHAKFLWNAAACLAVFCKENAFYVEDGSAATQNILLAARAQGLGSCWVAGDKQAYAPAVAKLLNAPQDHKFFSLITLGYPAEDPSIEKRPLQALLHWESF